MLPIAAGVSGRTVATSGGSNGQTGGGFDLSRTTRTRRRASRLGLGIALTVALVAAGCGASGDDDLASVKAANAPRLPTAGLPRPLAANIRQANRIIDGPGDQLTKKLNALRGHPVVVNQWASWCDPCRFEFPFFQAASRRHRTEVAFLGLDMQDDKDSARKFLEELPVPFPSIFDPDAGYTSSLGGGQSSPTTFFIDARGKVVSVRPGAYANPAQLEADIERFLLQPRNKA